MYLLMNIHKHTLAKGGIIDLKHSNWISIYLGGLPPPENQTPDI